MNSAAEKNGVTPVTCHAEDSSNVKPKAADSEQTLRDFTPKSLPCFQVFDTAFQYEGRRMKAGLYYLGLNRSGDPAPPKKISDPIYIEAKTRDKKSSKWGTLLAWHDPDGLPKKTIISDSTLSAAPQSALEVLADGGLKLNPIHKGLLLQYIATSDVLKRGVVVEKQGWANDETYVLPNTTISACQIESYFIASSYNLETSSAKGTLQQWQENVAALCVGNSRLLFATSMAFAAPLLRAANVQGGGFHFFGGSSIGKTLTMRVAASVISNPDSTILTWRATDNGLEGVAAKHNDSLLLLDELGQFDGRRLGEVAYMLANGLGKARSNKLGIANKPFSWRLLFMSTGEIEFADHLRDSGGRVKAGHEVRMISIPADAKKGHGLFENLHGCKTSLDFANQIQHITSDFYGSAFLPLIEFIVDNKALVQTMINDLTSEFMTSFCPENADSQVKRAAMRFALVAVGGEIASFSGVTGWLKGESIRAAGHCFNDWIQHRGSIHSHEEAEVISRIRTAIVQRAHLFEHICGQNQIRSPLSNRLGFYQDEAFIFTSEGFKEVMSGISIDFAEQVLKRQGLIKHGIGKERPRRRLPDIGQQRVYIIHSAELERCDSVTV
ncbi:hypothetical protein A1OO_03325 [Enterovibrio norvegicus FF-33]|uniref:DUF927 domain-containing protein n=1 Tax=Enterovibrio norvegicus TaxID=188144 RepID=UPI0002FA0054|nr:DUF927 domain-containing protein [Enterovibrio norvegicus]OEE69826.1 hypothetical protein A1OO_03325 [Enterovibrio norvegicus FF-33]